MNKGNATVGGSALIWIVAGTRPEVIKLAPVYHAARRTFGADAVHWISTGQHEALEVETLALFSIRPDRRLAVRGPDDTLVELIEKTVNALSDLQEIEKPALVVVQGDTLTTFAAAFAAFHANVPVAHVEAGLRTGDIHDPFPEEAYRRMTDAIADLHFPPTQREADTLLREGFRPETIAVTGNTAIDTLALVPGIAGTDAADPLSGLPDDARLAFVTLHRREAWGERLEAMCSAVRDLVRRFADLHVLLPVHVNPHVRGTVGRILGGVERIRLADPLDYAACQRVMRRSYLILTDSGGITEEAPSHGVPVVVLRDSTERPEALEAGVAVLAGTDHDRIVAAAVKILETPSLHDRMRSARNPFGDGEASRRIVTAIARYFDGTRPLLTPDEMFR